MAAQAEKAEKLKRFITETSADENVANYYLQTAKWNLETAIAGFKELKLAEEKRVESRDATLGKERPNIAGGSETRSRSGVLQRGFSMANTDLVANAREKIVISNLSNRLDTSFVLPNIALVKDKDLVHFIKNDLIDKGTYQSLTKAGVLNWWAEPKVSACRKLFPMSTVGDGNCLLHAVSLAMWGFHDRLLTLRNALHRSLTNVSANGPLKRRWMYQQWKLNMDAGGLCFTHQEWEDEWAAMVRLASDRPRSQNNIKTPNRRISQQYSIAISTHHDESMKRSDSQGSDSLESLEEFHVFALAHVIRRPIIIVSDVMLRDLDGEPLQPIHFSGIYLPIECDPAICYKYPLILGYDSGHFAALVPAEGEDVATNKTPLLSNIPLTRPNYSLLPLHFVTDPGASWPLIQEDSKKKKLNELSKQEELALLSKYLHVMKLDCSSKGTSIIPSFQSNESNECELDASDLGNLYKKKGKESQPFLTKAFGNIITLVPGYSNATKTSPRLLRGNSGTVLYMAKLNITNRPEYFDQMIENYIISARRKLSEINTNDNKSSSSTRINCANAGCTFYGAPETNFLCSKCFKYQQDFSKVHKSMPSLQDDKPPLFKLASRHLSNPEGVDFDDSLIRFDDVATSKPFRPATAPPHDIVMNEEHLTSGRNFESPSSIFSSSRKATPTAPFPSMDEIVPKVERSSTTPDILLPHTEPCKPLRHPLDEFDPLRKEHSTNSIKRSFPPVSQFCRGEGCKIFGSSVFDGFCQSCYSRMHHRSGFV